MSDSVQPHRRQPTGLPCPWDSPGKNTGVGCHFLLLLSHFVSLCAPKHLKRIFVPTDSSCPQTSLFDYTYAIGEGNGTPLQYSCLENLMDGGAWWAAVHGVAESWTQLSNFPFTFHFHALEKEMATHSSVLAWRIPGMAEPGGLPSMGLHRVGHN